MNSNFGILLNPKTILEVEDLKESKIKDMFLFENKVSDFVNYVNEYIESRKSIVVGIYGGYGTGKSVFVNLVKNKVVENDNCKFITFHAWKYKDEKSIWRNFILDVSNKLQNNKEKNDLNNSLYYTKEKTEFDKNAIIKDIVILASINIIYLLWILNSPTVWAVEPLTIINIVFSIYIYYSTKRIKQPVSSIEEFDKEFKNIINNCGVDKLYIVIENIDRCLPHNSIRILESLNAFLESNDSSKTQCIFLIPCDKNILEQAIIKDNSNLENFNASTYLDKLIQLPYDLPVSSNENWKNYVKSLLNKDYKNKTINFNSKKNNLIEEKTFTDWIIEMLEFADIKNPREIKILFREWEMRFVNLPYELKNNEEKIKTNALVLLKMLIFKRRDYTNTKLKKDIYKSIEAFCLLFKGKLIENFENSKTIFSDFEKDIQYLQKISNFGNITRDNFDSIFKDFTEKSYYFSFKNYIMKNFLDINKEQLFNINKNTVFKFILNERIKGAVTLYELDNISIEKSDIENKNNILNEITTKIFSSTGALQYIVGVLGLSLQPKISKIKITESKFEKILLNRIRPSSFEELQKIMITIKPNNQKDKEVNNLYLNNREDTNYLI